jgi:hypothetical protein
MHPILFLAATVLIFLIDGLPIVLLTAPDWHTATFCRHP